MVRKYMGNGRWEDVPGTAPAKTVAANLDLDGALEEVATRFLVHLPDSELQSGDRLFFQIEQAHWFYEDFLADAEGSSLPHLHLRKFAQKMFQSVELLKPLRKHYEELFNEFRAYKGKIPVCGCVLLDSTLTKVVLVQNWAKTSWGLPKGKLNQNEKKAECAIREVGEETGYDVLLSFAEEEALEVVNQDQHAAMFVVPDVDVNFVFEPRVRKEISSITFFPLDALPSKQWGVDTYVPKIKRWVKRYKLKNKHSAKAVPVEEDEVSPPASPRAPVPLSPSSITRGSPRRQAPLVFDFGSAKILAAFDEKFDPCLARARRELEDALVEADQRSASRSPETELEPTPPPRPRRAAVTRASAVAAASKDGGWGAAAAAPPKRKKTKKKKGKTPPPPVAATMNDDEEGYA